jgi:hypothetical protein
VGYLLVLTAASAQVALGQGSRGFPDDSGWSGNISAGLTYISAASNFATDRYGLGDDSVDSLDQQADRNGAFVGFPRIEVNYTFAESGWQLHLGNAALDFYRFDRANVAGVRRKLDGVGILGIGYVFSALPDYVWEDPYRLATDREKTRRRSAGGRFTWDYIGGTPVSFRYTQRQIRISDDFSGAELGLNPRELESLQRDGSQRVAEINVFVPLGRGMALLPALSYIGNDRDGEAVSNQALQLTIVLRAALSERLTLLAEVLGGRLQADEDNPIFSEREENSRYGAALTLRYSQLFGYEPLALIVRAGSYRERSNIDFYAGDIDSIGAFIAYDF